MLETEKGQNNINFLDRSINPFALRKAKTPYSFGFSECNRAKLYHAGSITKEVQTLQPVPFFVFFLFFFFFF